MDKVDYYGIEKCDKICPLLSIHQVQWDGTLRKCVGISCMWYGECEKKQIINLKPTRR